jgi:ABC-2 type transport system ATP-binding protein
VLLAVERARVQFGTLVAVRDLSFELRAGSLLGLIGPNGAGKTTLLRAIAGLQPLTCGRVTVMGEPVVPGNLAFKPHIGFTADTPAAYEEMTVREFLRFIAMGYGLHESEARSRTDFWLEQVWLSVKADEKIKALSRGMRQRLGIARTLMPNPNIILLDEPAAGLDPAGRVQFRQLLCSLRDQGKTLIVSSHILADLNDYCSHIAIMAHGTFLQMGTVHEVATNCNGDRCRYTITLVRPIAGLGEDLARIRDVTNVQLDRDRAVLEYSADREQAAALLAELVRRGVPVASFAPHSPGLEEAYLRTGIRQVD